MPQLRSVSRWKSDEEARLCEGCDSAFGLLRRRHHCRYCGGIFCGECTSHRAIVKQVHRTEPQRLCARCFAVFAFDMNGSKLV